MDTYSPELTKFIELLDNGGKLVAMLAPSFPVMFEYPEIVGELKRLGFSYVVEVSRGALETNRELTRLVEEDKTARFITGPCPTIVRLIKAQYPHLVKYLAPVKSPMAYTAEVVQSHWSGYQPVFIGPCLLKKKESTDDDKALGILVLTYKELLEVFKLKNIKSSPEDYKESFDLIGMNTRLYAVSGGLTQSAELNYLLTDDELDVISGPERVKKALEDFPKNKIRVLDILNCDGGCIAGPGIESDLPLEKRRAKVIAHWAKIAQ
jgi:iron only hydrogenase large subunit-like protein